MKSAKDTVLLIVLILIALTVRIRPAVGVDASPKPVAVPAPAKSEAAPAMLPAVDWTTWCPVSGFPGVPGVDAPCDPGTSFRAPTAKVSPDGAVPLPSLSRVETALDPCGAARRTGFSC